MRYDFLTMVERGVVWAEDHDPFGHVMQSHFMAFLGTCFHRVMESYDEFLSEDEYNDMILAKTIVPVVRKYELEIRRQVVYPGSVGANCDTSIDWQEILIRNSSFQRIGRVEYSADPQY